MREVLGAKLIGKVRTKGGCGVRKTGEDRTEKEDFKETRTKRWRGWNFYFEDCREKGRFEGEVTFPHPLFTLISRTVSREKDRGGNTEVLGIARVIPSDAIIGTITGEVRDFENWRGGINFW